MECWSSSATRPTKSRSPTIRRRSKDAKGAILPAVASQGGSGFTGEDAEEEGAGARGPNLIEPLASVNAANPASATRGMATRIAQKKRLGGGLGAPAGPRSAGSGRLVAKSLSAGGGFDFGLYASLRPSVGGSPAARLAATSASAKERGRCGCPCCPPSHREGA